MDNTMKAKSLWLLVALMSVIHQVNATSCGAYDESLLEPESEKCGLLYKKSPDLSYCDLSFRTLNGLDLSNADLTGANLEGADLSNINLQNAKLNNANLKGVRLELSQLHGANLTNADMRSAFLVKNNKDSSSPSVNLSGTCINVSPLKLGLRDWLGYPNRNYSSVELVPVQVNQSSVNEDGFGFLAIDGDLNTISYTSKKQQGEHWIMFDLGANYWVTSISLDAYTDDEYTGNYKIHRSHWRELTNQIPEYAQTHDRYSENVARYIWLSSVKPIAIREISIMGRNIHTALPVTQPQNQWSVSEYLQTETYIEQIKAELDSDRTAQSLSRWKQITSDIDEIRSTLDLLNKIRLSIDTGCAGLSDVDGVVSSIPPIGPLANVKNRAKQFIQPNKDECVTTNGKFHTKFWEAKGNIDTLFLAAQIGSQLSTTFIHEYYHQGLIERNTLNDAYFSVRNEHNDGDLESLISNRATSLELLANEIDEYNEDLAGISDLIRNIEGNKPSNSTLNSILSDVSSVSSIINTVSGPFRSINNALNAKKCITIPLFWPFDDIRKCFSVADILDGLNNIPFLSDLLSFASRVVDPIVNTILSKLGVNFPSINVNVNFDFLTVQLPDFPRLPSNTLTLEDLEELTNVSHWKTSHIFKGNEDFDQDGLSNAQERKVESPFKDYALTSSLLRDTDFDGIDDHYEVITQSSFVIQSQNTTPVFTFDCPSHILSPAMTIDAELDTDNDGLTNLAEYQIGSCPTLADTDNDGIIDKLEWANRLNTAENGELGLNLFDPRDAQLDFDGDGLSNKEEIDYGLSSVFFADEDGDGLSDLEELNPCIIERNFNACSNPTRYDSDFDNIPDHIEIRFGLQPTYALDSWSDTNNTGITNFEEYATTGALGNVSDTDSDGLFDVWELFYFDSTFDFNQNDDPDNDGLNNFQEMNNKTHPLVANVTQAEAIGYQYEVNLNQPNFETMTDDNELHFTDNNDVVIKDLNESFIFLGKVYSKLYIYPRGYVSFTDNGCSQACISGLFQPGLDIDLERSVVLFQDNYGVVTIQYVLYSMDPFSIPVEFQIELLSDSNRVELKYRRTLDRTQEDSHGGNAKVGLINDSYKKLIYTDKIQNLAKSNMTITFEAPISVALDEGEPIAIPGDEYIHNITVSSNLETPLNFNVQLSKGSLWDTQLVTEDGSDEIELLVSKETDAKFQVRVNVPNLAQRINPTDPSQTDRGFITLIDEASGVQLSQKFVTIIDGYSDIDGIKKPLIGDSESDSNKVAFSRHTGQTTTELQLQRIWVSGQYAFISRFNVMNTQSFDSIEWLANGSSVFFEMTPSKLGNIFNIDLTTELQLKPGYFLDFSSHAQEDPHLVVYYRGADNQLHSLSPDNWSIHNVAYYTFSEGQYINYLYMPLFEDGSQQDFDGLFNDNVIYNLQFGRLVNPPTGINDSYIVARGETLVPNAEDGILANDINLANDASVHLLEKPKFGELKINNDGSFTYQHNGNFEYVDQFVYRIEDARYFSGPVTVQINIEQAAQIVTEGYQQQVTNEDDRLVFELKALDDKVGLNWSISEQPQNGTASIIFENDQAMITYSPTSNSYGSDSITVQIIDSDGNVTTRVIHLNVQSINDNPIAVDDSYIMAPGKILNISPYQGVIANDIDVDSTELTASITQLPQHGTVSFNSDGSFSYQHHGDYDNQLDSFRYQLTDNDGGQSIEAVVEIDIVIDAQSNRAFDDFYETDENSTLETHVDNGVLSNDDLTAQVEVLTQPQYGNLVFDMDGSFKYVQDGSEATIDIFRYQLIGSTSSQSSAQVTINITPVNDIPRLDIEEPIEQVMYGSREVLEFDLTAFDPDSAILEWRVVAIQTIEGVEEEVNITVDSVDELSSEQGLGTVFVERLEQDTPEQFNTRLHYQTRSEFIGVIKLRLYLSDELGASSDYPILISVEPHNSKPVSQDDVFSVEQGGIVLIDPITDLMSNDFDEEGELLTLQIVELPNNGELIVEGEQLYYQHDGSSTVVDSLIYQSYDGKQFSEPATVFFNIMPVQQSPIINEVMYQRAGYEGEQLVLSVKATDPNPDDELSYSWEQLSGPIIELVQTDLASIAVTLPQVSTQQVVELAVTISDSHSSVQERLQITVNNRKQSGATSVWILMILFYLSLYRVRSKTYR